MGFGLSNLTLLVNGLTLSLTLGFLIILLWQDSRNQIHIFFSAFLGFVILWNIGSFLIQITLLSVENFQLGFVALGFLELGFTGSSVSVYLFAIAVVGIHNLGFRVLAFASLAIVVAYRLFLIVIDNGQAILDLQADGLPNYELHSLSVLFYIVFDVVALFVIWYFRRKRTIPGLSFGLVVFVLGQSLIFINPELLVASLSTAVSSIGVLIMGFALLRQRILLPLAERNSQIESMHRVSLAVISQIAVDTVLDEMVLQAATWLGADGAGIFLKEGGRANDVLKLVTVYELPVSSVGMTVVYGKGIVGRAADTEETVFLQDYSREWLAEDDLPLARDTFGSLICVPLTYADNTIGVLFVVSGRQGKLFDRDDVHLLELLSAQVAVVISHSQLFGEQKQLTELLRSAHNQLQAVLFSTDSPVVAVDRQFRLIFANPAARKLFPVREGENVLNSISVDNLPGSLLGVYRQVKREGQFVYEFEVENKSYLCHIARLGSLRLDGWVAVLNDVTELKELDRLKSEMVRMASHDLKNPLMGAFAYLDLIRDEAGSSDTKSLMSLTDTLETQLERMERIIGGILNLEKMAIVGSHIALCSPVDIVERAVDELKHMIDDKDINVHVRLHVEGSFVRVDVEQFTRVLVNLLENAIKFSPSGGKVDVEVHREDANIVFSVRDEGIGIPGAIRSKVFDRFFRGQQAGVEHVSGTGLGLSLVKTIVENHNGRVWLDDSVVVGSRFIVSIPHTVISHSQ